MQMHFLASSCLGYSVNMQIALSPQMQLQTTCWCESSPVDVLIEHSVDTGLCSVHGTCYHLADYESCILICPE